MDDLRWIFVLVFVTIITLRMNRSHGQITLPAHKFWSFVRSQDKPVVLLTTRGYLIKRMCYVFPYQGVLFCTDARGTEAPDGVTLIGTGDSFSMS